GPTEHTAKPPRSTTRTRRSTAWARKTASTIELTRRTAPRARAGTERRASTGGMDVGPTPRAGAGAGDVRHLPLGCVGVSAHQARGSAGLETRRTGLITAAPMDSRSGVRWLSA